MRGFAVACFIVLIFMSGIYSPMTGSGDGLQIPTNGLKVEERHVYVTQQSDRSTFWVEEYVFFNNSGTSTFNGTVYDWVPDNANIIAQNCDNATNVGCRVFDFYYVYCFTFVHQDQNVIKGNPIGTIPLSYYGQKATVTVNAQSQNNSSYSDALALNVTLGNESGDPNPSIPEGVGVHLYSNVTDLGARATAYPGIASNMTIKQTLFVFNNGTSNDTVDLGVQGLPNDWNATFLNGSQPVTEVSLEAGETKNVSLLLKAPSYLVEVLLSYSIDLHGTGQDSLHPVLDKAFLYDNEVTVMYIYTNNDDNLTVSEGLTLVHSQEDAETGMTVHVVYGIGLPPETQVAITFSLKGDQTSSWLILLAALVVFAVPVAYAVLVRRRRRKAKEGGEAEGTEEGGEEEKGEEPVVQGLPEGTKSTTEQKSSREGTPEDIAKRKGAISKSLERLETDHGKGLISDGVYREMKKDLVKKDAELDDRLRRSQDSGLSALEDEKEKMLKATRELKRDLDSGKISKEVYEELRGAYKKRTIELMKEMDALKKK